MAEYNDKLNEALKDAMRNKDGQRRDALRLLTSAFKQVEVDTRKELTAEIEMDILIKEAKKRRESIDELAGAGRDTTQERYELEMIESFLPAQLSREEIEALVRDAIAKTGASSAKEMGKVMGLITPQTKGKADGKLVSTIVKEMLG
jgi:hypothetical protein